MLPGHSGSRSSLKPGMPLSLVHQAAFNSVPCDLVASCVPSSLPPQTTVAARNTAAART